MINKNLIYFKNRACSCDYWYFFSFV